MPFSNFSCETHSDSSLHYISGPSRTFVHDYRMAKEKEFLRKLALINRAGGLYGTENLDRGRKYRPNAVTSVHRTSVPYRST